MILIALMTVDGSRMSTLSPSRIRERGNARDGCSGCFAFALDVEALGAAAGSAFIGSSGSGSGSIAGGALKCLVGA